MGNKLLSAILASLIILLSFPKIVFGEIPSLKQTVDQATSLYNQGSYEAAAHLYLQAIDQGLNNGHIYYNLANTYYRLGQKGLAIAFYRKALLELPRYTDIKANLELTRKSLPEIQLSEDPNTLNAIYAKLFFLKQYLNASELQSLFILSYVLFWLILLSKYFTKNAFLNIFFYLSLILSTYLCINIFFIRLSASGLPKFTVYSQSNIPAIIIAKQANIFSGNSETFQVVFVLSDGAEIEIQEIRDNWIKILLPDGRLGWTKKENAKVI